jgi:hypothetical protein
MEIVMIVIASAVVVGLIFIDLKAEKVINKERKFGSAQKYINYHGLLFTQNEIKVAKERTEKNKEDL